MKRVLLTCLLLLGTLSAAQEVIRVDIGLHDPVVNAWNPIVVHGRDLPGYTLQIDVLLGTLRETERVETHTFAFPPGRGTVFLEEHVRLPADTRAVAWRVRTEEATIASGQVSAGAASEAPLVVVVGGAPPLELLATDMRVGELQAHELSTDPVVYDGVAALLLTGQGAAPSPESIVAAAAMGAHVFVPTSASAQYSTLAQLVTDGLGAGLVTQLSPTLDTVEAAVAAWETRTEQRATALLDAPDLPALPFSGRSLTLALLVYLALARALMYVPGLPGVISVLLLTIAVSAASVVALQGTGEISATAEVNIASGGLARIDVSHTVVYRGGDTVREFVPPAVERAL